MTAPVPPPDPGDSDIGHVMSQEDWDAVVAERNAYLASIGEAPEDFSPPAGGGS